MSVGSSSPGHAQPTEPCGNPLIEVAGGCRGRGRARHKNDVPARPWSPTTTSSSAQDALAAIPDHRAADSLAGDKKHAAVAAACSWCTLDYKCDGPTRRPLAMLEDPVDLARICDRLHGPTLRPDCQLVTRRSGTAHCVPYDDERQEWRGRHGSTYACGNRASSRASDCLADMYASL